MQWTGWVCMTSRRPHVIAALGLLMLRQASIILQMIVKCRRHGLCLTPRCCRKLCHRCSSSSMRSVTSWLHWTVDCQRCSQTSAATVSVEDSVAPPVYWVQTTSCSWRLCCCCSCWCCGGSYVPALWPPSSQHTPTSDVSRTTVLMAKQVRKSCGFVVVPLRSSQCLVLVMFHGECLLIVYLLFYLSTVTVWCVHESTCCAACCVYYIKCVDVWQSNIFAFCVFVVIYRWCTTCSAVVLKPQQMSVITWVLSFFSWMLQAWGPIHRRS